MNFQVSFYRKIAYILAIAVLLIPLAALSQPATTGRSGDPAGNSPGGKLSRLRSEYNLSQAELGEIDPASEAMKLSTLGLRGVAANYLWISAMHYQKVQDYSNFEATLNQIARIQPNFLRVLDFEAHNLTYNTSVEFDDVQDRYDWVKRGIAFLIRGVHYNRDEPGLLYQIGWFLGQKVGTADEKKQYRRYYRDDKELHQQFSGEGIRMDDSLSFDGKDRKPDSWYTGALWYLKAEDHAVDAKTGKSRLRLKTPLIFFNARPMSLAHGASDVESDYGVFGEPAQQDWRRAAELLDSFGEREIPTSLGFSVFLNRVKPLADKQTGLREELDQLTPGKREQMRKQKIDELPPGERAIYDKPAKERTVDEQNRFYYAIKNKVVSGNEDQLISATATGARARVPS